MLRSRNHHAQRRRLRGLSVGKLIPNIITVSAACCGLTGIRFAIEGRWDYAVTAIIVAAILDALDGRMARILRASSEFGAELDSLSDIVSFGVSPAIILYFWTLQDAGGVGWAIILFYIVCCALRLARFNSMHDKMPPYAFNYFTGVPAPAGALMSLLPLVIALGFNADWTMHPLVTGTWVAIMAALMVSRMPSYSFKRIKVPQRYVLPFLVAVGLTLAGLAAFPWIVLTGVAVVYLGTFPYSVRSYTRLKREAEILHATVPENPGDDGEFQVEDDQKDSDDSGTNIRPL
ncbi:MAG: CDP-diacylglycerol--serine O-phosphatidyltransferase [Alphaproteobacteria bacterium]